MTVELSFEVDAVGPAKSRLDQDGYIFNPSNPILRPYLHVEIWMHEKGGHIFTEGKTYRVSIRSLLSPPVVPALRPVAEYGFAVQRVRKDDEWQGTEVVLDPVDERLTDLSFVRLLFSDELLEFEEANNPDRNSVEAVRFSERERPTFRDLEQFLVSFALIDT